MIRLSYAKTIIPISFYVLYAPFEGCIDRSGETVLALKIKAFPMSSVTKRNSPHICEALIMYDDEFSGCNHSRYSNTEFQSTQCF